MKITHWLDGGNGINRFHDLQLSLYQEAIKASGDNDLNLVKDEGTDCHWLICDSYRDLTSFWAVFRKIKKEKQNPQEIMFDI